MGRYSCRKPVSSVKEGWVNMVVIALKKAESSIPHCNTTGRLCCTHSKAIWSTVKK